MHVSIASMKLKPLMQGINKHLHSSCVNNLFSIMKRSLNLQLRVCLVWRVQAPSFPPCASYLLSAILPQFSENRRQCLQSWVQTCPSWNVHFPLNVAFFQIPCYIAALGPGLQFLLTFWLWLWDLSANDLWVPSQLRLSFSDCHMVNFNNIMEKSVWRFWRMAWYSSKT